MLKPVANSTDFIFDTLAKSRAIGLGYLHSRSGLFWRWVVSIGVLLLAPIVGVLVAEQELLLVIILAAPIGLLALNFLLPRLELGPVVVLSAAAFVPFGLPTGTGSPLVISLLLSLVFIGNWVLKMLLLDKRLSLKPSPVNKPLLGFMAITLFALVWSFAYRDPLLYTWKSFPVVQVASAVVMIMLPGTFLLVANHIQDLKPLKAMVAIVLIAGVIGVIEEYGGPDLRVNTGGLFSMWVISISVSLVLFNRKLSWSRRSLLLVLAGLWLYLRFGQQISWLAGWLPSFVALGIIVFMRSKKLLLIGLVLAVILIGLNADYYLGSVLEAESEESGHTRLAAWEVNWRVTGKHLLLGTGPAGYAAYYMNYYPDDGMATHSNYIDIIAQTGLFGFLFSLWFFFRLAWLGYKLCLRLRGRGDFVEGLANAALAGTVGCIVIMGFGDWLFPFAYTQTIAGYDHAVYSWLFMGTTVALNHITQPKLGLEDNG